MDFRVEERDWWHLEHLWRQENRKWRREDIEQRVLENARWVWLRYAEKNRRDVEEKSEQLKSISNLSALLGGFAVVAFVELQFSDPEVKPSHVSEILITAYAGTTALTVALMLNSMVLCSFMLCSILRNGKTYVSEDEEADYLYRCRKFALEFKEGDVPPQPQRSFEKHWETRCEDDWKHAFRMFTMGVPVFLINVACIAWLKFHYSYAAAGTVTCVAVVATFGWVHTQNNWGWHIERTIRNRSRHPSVHLAGVHGPAGLPFDWHARPRHAGLAGIPPSGFRTGEPAAAAGGRAENGDASACTAGGPAVAATHDGEGADANAIAGGVAKASDDPPPFASTFAGETIVNLPEGVAGPGGEVGPIGGTVGSALRSSGHSGGGTLRERRGMASWGDVNVDVGPEDGESIELEFIARTSPRARDAAALAARAATMSPGPGGAAGQEAGGGEAKDRGEGEAGEDK